MSKQQAGSAITTNPIAELISRKRTYTLAQIRSDYRDAQTQLVVLLTQLHEEGFTGQLVFHFSEGRVGTVETVQNQKIKPTT